jgi:hypothetical protein
LWLSRGNHYILYLKAMTVQMRVWRVWRTGFPQERFSAAGITLFWPRCALVDECLCVA